MAPLAFNVPPVDPMAWTKNLMPQQTNSVMQSSANPQGYNPTSWADKLGWGNTNAGSAGIGAPTFETPYQYGESTIAGPPNPNGAVMGMGGSNLPPVNTPQAPSMMDNIGQGVGIASSLYGMYNAYGNQKRADKAASDQMAMWGKNYDAQKNITNDAYHSRNMRRADASGKDYTQGADLVK
jgi:hypothetical protein